MDWSVTLICDTRRIKVDLSGDVGMHARVKSWFGINVAVHTREKIGTHVSVGDNHGIVFEFLRICMRVGTLHVYLYTTHSA